MPAYFDAEAVTAALTQLCGSNLFEIRILKGRESANRSFSPNYSGYFNDPAKAAKALELLRYGWQGAYFTPNPLHSDLLAREGSNILVRVDRGDATSDIHVLRRHWLLIDIDAKRIKGISATNSEIQAARLVAQAIRDGLAAAQIPSIWATSGNGWHLMISIDLPCESELPHSLILALGAKYNSDAVDIDPTVANPSRIWKLYGTLACKGTSTADRSHRMAQLLDIPQDLSPVAELTLQTYLESITAKPAPPEPAPSGKAKPAKGAQVPFDAIAAARRCGLDLDAPHAHPKGGEVYPLKRCPCPRQTEGAAFYLPTSGAPSVNCRHATCEFSSGAGSAGDHWKKLRKDRDPEWHEYTPPEDNTAILARAQAMADRQPVSPPILGLDPLIDWPVPLYNKDGEFKGPSKVHLENTQALFDAYGIRLRHNLMSHLLEIDVPHFGPSPERAANVNLAKVIEVAERRQLAKEQTLGHIQILAKEYHPVRDWILSKPWDGLDRAPQLFATITPTTQADEQLSSTLLRRWLVSAVKAVMPAVPGDQPFTPQGVLVFQGAQGVGKTSWLKSLSPPDKDWIVTGRIIDAHKTDSIQQLTGFWLAELGELDSTFKRSDVAALKSLVTLDFDVYRVPYARAAERVPRRTVLFASVNRPDFLVDETGNRRWWTIPVHAVNWRHNLDLQQVWAQVAHWLTAGEPWWLTQAEQDRLAVTNARHEIADPLIEDLWDTWEIAPSYANARATISVIWAGLPGRENRTRSKAESSKLANSLRAAGAENQTVTHGCATFRVQKITVAPTEAKPTWHEA